jgi:hypothetical protein
VAPVLSLAAGLAVAVTAWGAHPLHTTLAELRYDEKSATLEVSVRAFADDLVAAAGGAGDAAAVAYVARGFSVADRDRRGVAFASCGVRRTGDLAWICLRATVRAGMDGALVSNRLLVERYADQVNIVRAEVGGRVRTMLFTRSDATRRIAG